MFEPLEWLLDLKGDVLQFTYKISNIRSLLIVLCVGEIRG